MTACPMLCMVLHVQLLLHSNQPRIALHVQLLPTYSSQLCVTLHVQTLLHSISPRAKLYPAQPYLVWPGRRRPFFAFAPSFCSQLSRTYFSALGLWCIAQLFLSALCMSYRTRVHSWGSRPASWWSNLWMDRSCRAASVYWWDSIWWLQMERLFQVGRHIHIWFWIDCPLL